MEGLLLFLLLAIFFAGSNVLLLGVEMALKINSTTKDNIGIVMLGISIVFLTLALLELR